MPTLLANPAINLQSLWTLHRECLKIGVRYGLGAKAPSMNAKTGEFGRIDCSGYVRWLLHRTSSLKTFPDGSWIQRQWCENHNLPQVPYEAMGKPQKSRLFIAFITAGVNGCGKVGHVWLLAESNGAMVTIESHGGKGVNSRPWNQKTLRAQVHKCFELPFVAASVSPPDKPKSVITPSTPTTKPTDADIQFYLNNFQPIECVMVGNRPFVPARDILERVGYVVTEYADRSATEKRFLMRVSPERAQGE